MLTWHGRVGHLPFEEMKPRRCCSPWGAESRRLAAGARWECGNVPALLRYRPQNFCLLALKKQLEMWGMVFWLCCLVRNCHSRLTFVGTEVSAQGL